MLLAAIAILTGFVILIWSADLFVAGAASIAANFGVSPIIIGLTIVSVGTSAPEVLVSILATWSGAGQLAIGNAIGSNIANIGLVLGVTLMVAPLMVDLVCLKKEIPILLIATAGAWLLLLDGVLSQVDGLAMVAVLALIIVHLARAQSGDPVLRAEACEEPLPHMRPARAWLSFFIGLALLIASSRILVWGAVFAARELGVSELVIGLTVVAIGTSLPELASTVACALRGHTDIALGNIIGSNLFNLLVVMAIPGIIHSIDLEPAVLSRDYPAMSILTVLLIATLVISRWRNKSRAGHAYMGRSVGVLLAGSYALYYCWLYATLL